MTIPGRGGNIRESPYSGGIMGRSAPIVGVSHPIWGGIPKQVPPLQGISPVLGTNRSRSPVEGGAPAPQPPPPTPHKHPSYTRFFPYP